MPMHVSSIWRDARSRVFMHAAMTWRPSWLAPIPALARILARRWSSPIARRCMLAGVKRNDDGTMTHVLRLADDDGDDLRGIGLRGRRRAGTEAPHRRARPVYGLFPALPMARFCAEPPVFFRSCLQLADLLERKRKRRRRKRESKG